jgi:hypothetical protein
MLSSDGVGGVRFSYSSFMPSPDIGEIITFSTHYVHLPEFFAGRIRIQNLRFAYLLCAAQEVSIALKK